MTRVRTQTRAPFSPLFDPGGGDATGAQEPGRRASVTGLDLTGDGAPGPVAAIQEDRHRYPRGSSGGEGSIIRASSSGSVLWARAASRVIVRWLTKRASVALIVCIPMAALDCMVE